jgi:hypothetical protein
VTGPFRVVVAAKWREVSRTTAAASDVGEDFAAMLRSGGRPDGPCDCR